MERPNILEIFNYWIYIKSPPYLKLLYDKYFNKEVYNLVTNNKSKDIILEKINKTKFSVPYYSSTSNEDKNINEDLSIIEKRLLLSYYLKVYFSFFSTSLVTIFIFILLKKAKYDKGLIRYYVKNNKLYRRSLFFLLSINLSVILLVNITDKNEEKVIKLLNKSDLNNYKKLV
jgi:hypothetical protein